MSPAICQALTSPLYTIGWFAKTLILSWENRVFTKKKSLTTKKIVKPFKKHARSQKVAQITSHWLLRCQGALINYIFIICVRIEFNRIFSFWVFLEFYFRVLSQFEFLCLVKISIFEDYQNFSLFILCFIAIWVLSLDFILDLSQL